MSGAISSVDGIGFLKCEPSPFSLGWYSDKFNDPALRFKTAIGIEQGNLVWYNGTFMTGANFDSKCFFKSRLKHELSHDEPIIADRGYRDVSCITSNNELSSAQRLNGKIQARLKTFNPRLKAFSALGHWVRHPVHQHASVFFCNFKRCLFIN